MKSISKILMIVISLLSYTACTAQIKNSTTTTVAISGNCDMCKATIEKAGNDKNMAKVDWNKDTKKASITYDAKKTTLDVVLKKIALAGYDNEQFVAPDEVYAQLPGCCQYERAKKTAVVEKHSQSHDKGAAHDHSQHDGTTAPAETNELKPVFDRYFMLKDALVKSDGATAATKAKEFISTINAVQMEKLATKEHTVWMSVMKKLSGAATLIAETKNIAKQRNAFSNLSKDMYTLIAAAPQTAPVYYQHCPMYDDGKGAHWLSKEDAVKNPYYGATMLTCGKTVETISK
ncbi:mercury transporter [Taibaiella sp. KBW10]|uniref:DUF3347 domain-containing protein n=1 Tax=Taibaiella sp. KBW10 TaxID=2153357 RepID=UPI000F59AA3B|nr:DUF3347 domain-containing protein [Taibaiella sp. KBW10]RQO30738.1 mercury transporter [Taibaiella sp. KBW10]